MLKVVNIFLWSSTFFLLDFGVGSILKYILKSVNNYDEYYNPVLVNHGYTIVQIEICNYLSMDLVDVLDRLGASRVIW